MKEKPVKIEKISKVPILWKVYEDDEEMRNHREEARKKSEKIHKKYMKKIEKQGAKLAKAQEKSNKQREKLEKLHAEFRAKLKEVTDELLAYALAKYRSDD